MKKYITAKELAEELLKHPNDIVCSVSDNFELRGSKVPKTSVYLHRFKGNITEESFTDAFDYTDYSTDVVEFDNKGKKNFVQI